MERDPIRVAVKLTIALDFSFIIKIQYELVQSVQGVSATPLS